ncbi:Sodium/glutamate symporter [Planctomycetes bacterium CA13]|uniref:Sodium/glutamate symporter n=1 Tax=Novipirellula herctigrandis TaxID=2527986 RepID=A0A5C5YNK3_9BACT|nr:Sodium/glutamate symporter [Planctomycetes bacterium CA13]
MILALVFTAILLVIGVAMRLRFFLFRWLYVPASVIAGIVGLAVIQLSHIEGMPDSIEWTAHSIAETLDTWPSWLIAVVFGGMLLERKSTPLREKATDVGRQALMVWIIVLGETAVGLLVTWLLIRPFFDVPASFGMLIETGFAGGHGTAAAMGEVLRHDSIGLSSGRDLGILMATVGLIYGILSGIVWINVAARIGWIKNHSRGEVQGNDTKLKPIGYARIRNETLDPLLLQIVWLLLAVGIGLILQQMVLSTAGLADGFIHQASQASQASAAERELSERLTFLRLVDFPLFIYTLFGGLLLRHFLQFLHCDQLIDSDSIARLTSASMDVLVVAAIASMNLMAVASLIVPFSILVFFGAVWTGVCLMVIARRVLPSRHWFELGLINFGMSTGTTATGFVLLRLVDPQLETDAAEDYALAAPFSAPFIGGGIVTFVLPLLVLERIPMGISAIVVTAMVAALVVVGIRWKSRHWSAETT